MFILLFCILCCLLFINYRKYLGMKQINWSLISNYKKQCGVKQGFDDSRKIVIKHNPTSAPSSGSTMNGIYMPEPIVNKHTILKIPVSLYKKVLPNSHK